MNSRTATWFAAIVFLAAGIWLSAVGWGKKWKFEGVMMRVGGAVALAAGAFCVKAARR